MIDNAEYDLSLIAEVENSPMLYDSDHVDFKCRDLKRDKWREIASRLKNSSDENSVKMVKSRWKSLRDSLVKIMRYRNAAPRMNFKPKKNWRYTDAMAFLLPYLCESNPAKGNRYKMRVAATKPGEPVERHLVAEEDLEEFVEDTASNQDDEIDSFFRGIADTVKKLTPENQVKAQREIMNVVLDTKLWEIKEAKDPSDSSSRLT